MTDPLATVREALRTICTTNDSGPWIAIYRATGGGYEGLQAIAREALAVLDSLDGCVILSRDEVEACAVAAEIAGRRELAFDLAARLVEAVANPIQRKEGGG